MACSVQSDLDLHYPQKLPVSLSVRKELTFFRSTNLDIFKFEISPDELKFSDRTENIVGKRDNAEQMNGVGNTVKPVLETTCIKRPPALRDHCSDTSLAFRPCIWVVVVNKVHNQGNPT